MPRRAPVVCTTPGCPHPQPCPTHPSRRWSDGASGYTQPAGWQPTRRRILNRDPVCQLGLPGCTIRATTVDHVVAASLGGSEDDGNLRGVCRSCHQAKTQAEAHAARWPSQS